MSGEESRDVNSKGFGTKFGYGFLKRMVMAVLTFGMLMIPRVCYADRMHVNPGPPDEHIAMYYDLPSFTNSLVIIGIICLAVWIVICADIHDEQERDVEND